MKKIFKLGVIGAGFMANAIIDGIINAEVLSPNDIICSDKNQDSLEKVKNKGVNVTLNNEYLANNSEFVLFAIKPQNLDDVVLSLNGSCVDKCISILAGTKKEKYKRHFKKIKVARCMPNTPCSINSGAIGVDVFDYEKQEDIEFVNNILSPLGAVVFTKEENLNTVTGISGSSPAYFYLFAKSLIDCGVKNGLDYEDSKTLVLNTMIGSAKMINKNDDKSIEELIASVCSKGGTTIEAMKVFEKENFCGIVSSAVDACINRSKELENI